MVQRIWGGSSQQNLRIFQPPEDWPVTTWTLSSPRLQLYRTWKLWRAESNPNSWLIPARDPNSVGDWGDHVWYCHDDDGDDDDGIFDGVQMYLRLFCIWHRARHKHEPVPDKLPVSVKFPSLDIWGASILGSRPLHMAFYQAQTKCRAQPEYPDQARVFRLTARTLQCGPDVWGVNQEPKRKGPPSEWLTCRKNAKAQLERQQHR